MTKELITFKIKYLLDSYRPRNFTDTEKSNVVSKVPDPLRLL